MRIGRLLAVAALSATLLVACGDDDDAISGAQASTTTTLALTTTAAPTPILIKDFSFSNLDVKAGSKILVQNQGTQQHTLTADDNRFDTGPIQPGRNVDLTVPVQAGTYKVHCTIHPDRMKGELKVT